MSVFLSSWVYLKLIIDNMQSSSDESMSSDESSEVTFLTTPDDSKEGGGTRKFSKLSPIRRGSKKKSLALLTSGLHSLMTSRRQSKNIGAREISRQNIDLKVTYRNYGVCIFSRGLLLLCNTYI